MYKHNFNAGPSHLPESVLLQCQQAIQNFQESGLSILEISHRGPLFVPVMEEARSLARELMQLDTDFEVLFLHGGGRMQFMQVAANLLDATSRAAYIDTGTWAHQSIEEARLFGQVDVVASSADKAYTYIPKEFHIPAGTSYLHITTNNTIYGTQFHAIPEVDVPLIADMSSDIMSWAMDFNKFSLIYAGAQKNIGAAGVSLVAVRKSLLKGITRPIPHILDYRHHIDQGSMLNTPPVFAVYTCMLTLRWLKEQGGVSAIERINREKAGLLYHAIDSYPLFKGTVQPEDRSLMNACFIMENKELESEFAETCKREGIYGIKGHRSVGGFRISLYNAVSLDSVRVLCDIMKDFGTRKS